MTCGTHGIPGIPIEMGSLPGEGLRVYFVHFFPLYIWGEGWIAQTDSTYLELYYNFFLKVLKLLLL